MASGDQPGFHSGKPGSFNINQLHIAKSSTNTEGSIKEEDLNTEHQEQLCLKKKKKSLELQPERNPAVQHKHSNWSH